MNITRNAGAGRFELDGEPAAQLVYAEFAGRIRLIHTAVPDHLRGGGVAAALAKAALDYARDHQLRVTPSCPFVRSYIARHPEYASLVD
jgi:uncharacterized protein